MMLWAVLTLLSLVAAGLIAWPLLRRMDAQAAREDHGLGLFRDQMRQLDRDVAEGAISSEEAAATRRDIERQVLAVARTHEGETMTVTSDKAMLVGVAIAVGWVVVGSAVLYTTIGRPDLGAARMATTPAPASDLAAAPTATPAEVSADGTPLPSVDAMTAQLAERLTREPGDLDGWRMLGWSYANLGRYADAAAAYAKAVGLAPGDAETQSLLGEALVNASQGQVGAEATAAFDKALTLDPANPRARYYQGVARDNAGDTAGAVTQWLALVDAAPPGAAWLPDVKARILDRAKAAGIDLTGRPDLLATAAPAAAAPAATPAESAPLSAAPPGPTAADVDAAAGMTPEARSTMIRGMVAQLAARLETQADDPDGWQRLIRAYVVLGDTQAASAALARATTAMAGNAAALAALKATAGSLGLTSP